MLVASYIYIGQFAPKDTTQLWVEPKGGGEVSLHVFSDGGWKVVGGGDGKSAYELAVEKGYSGTLDEWLDSLQGKSFTYDDLTDAQKAELAQDAVAAANRAAQAVETIEAAISDLDPSQSAEDAVVALAARQGVLESNIAALGPKIDQLYKEESIEEYTLDDGAEISFDTITLSQDGDFVEFDLVCNVQSGNRGRGFCGYDSQFAIGLYQYQVGMRSEANANINGFDFTNGQYNFNSSGAGKFNERGTLKIAYEDGQVAAYVNGTKVNTSSYSTTRPNIKINHIGKYTSNDTDYYWRGTIYGFTAKCGSTTYSKLSDIPNFSANSSVVIVTQHTETGKIADINESIDALDERVTELEGIDLSHNVDYTEETSEAQGTITAASIGTSGFVQHAYVTQSGLTSNYNQYDTYWFIADKAMKIWVSNKGGSGSFFRLLVGDGTLQSHTATSYESTTPPTSLNDAFDVAVGQLVALSVLTGTTSWVIANQYQKTDKVIEGYKITEVTDLQNRVQVLENLSGLPIAVVPVSSTQFQVQTTNRQGKVLIYKWELHNYSKTINNESVLCGNVWNQSMIYDSNNQQVIQGNNNFIFAIDGEVSGFEDEHKNFHAGPGHGCEVAKFTLFLADGKVIDPTTLSEPVYCSTFRATHSSEVYAVDATTSTAQSTDNSNNYPKVDANNVPIVAALHYIDWELREENSIKEYNRLIVKRNGTVFNQIHCAMLQCYVPKFTDILINDNAQSWVGVDSAEAGSSYIQHSAKSGTDFIWSPRLATRAIAYGNDISIRQDVVSLISNREGKMYIYTVPYNDRFKCYYMPAITTTSSQSAYETFNDGDKFEVEVHRKIEVR